MNLKYICCNTLCNHETDLVETQSNNKPNTGITILCDKCGDLMMLTISEDEYFSE